MADSIPPPTSLVTAYKAYAAATDRTPPDRQGGSPDRFGPAVTTPPLSASMQGAMEQVAKSADAPAAYDEHGRLKQGS